MTTQLVRRIDSQQQRAQSQEPEPALPPADDGRELAAELAANFAQILQFRRELVPLTEAETQALQATPERLEQIRKCPAEQVTWGDLDHLAKHDPAEARVRWQEVKDAARSEVTTGHRAARCVEIVDSGAWTRARFLAIRNGLHEAWQPRNELEMQLLDQMAQYEWLRQRRLELLVSHTALEHLAMRRAHKDEAEYERPSRTGAQAIADATRMVEACQRLYLKALRALQDLRRRPTLVVRSAGQVNVAERQINLCAAPQ